MGCARSTCGSKALATTSPRCSLHLDLSEPPRYRASAAHPELDRAFMVILGLDHADTFGEIVRHHEAGTIPPTVMWGACPTLFDATQAPAGRHTAFMWEKLPYRLRSGDWDSVRDAHAGEMLELWTQYAPNLADDTVGWFARRLLHTNGERPA